MVDVWRELGKAVGRAFKPLKDLAADIWTGFGDKSRELTQGLMRDAKGLKSDVQPEVTGMMPELFDEAASALGEASPPEEIKESVDKFVKALTKMIDKESKTEGKSLPTTEELALRQVTLIAGIIGLYAVTHAVSLALDATHPLKNWGFKAAIMDTLFQFKMSDVIGPMIQAPIWASVVAPLRMHARANNPYEVPSVGVLPYLAAKDVITPEAYIQNMKYHAFDETWSKAMLENTWRYPTFSELRTMVHRGVKTWAETRISLQRALIKAEYLDAYEKMIPSIPGVSDLVRFAVREAYPDATTFTEHYAKMTSWIGQQGYSKYFADAFWTAHWIIPTTSQADTLLHRGDITEPEHTALYILNDIRPEDIDKLRGLTWSLPGRIDARWLFRWGEIDVGGLRDLLVKGGLNPEYADQVAEATAKNQFLTLINREISNVKADYVKGYSVEDNLRGGLGVLGLRSEMVEYHVQDALADRARGMRDEELRTLRSQYARGAMTMAAVMAAAEKIIVDEDARIAWLAALPSAKQVVIMEETYGTEVNRLVANAKYDYVRGYITKSAMVARFQLLDLPSGVIEFHVMDADEDRARGHKDKALSHIEEGYIDDVIDWEKVEEMAKPILIDEAAYELFLDGVYLNKHKAVRVAASE